MPAKSAKQYRLMAGIAHGMNPRSAAAPSVEVAKEFVHKTSPEKRRAFMKGGGKKKKKYSMKG